MTLHPDNRNPHTHMHMNIFSGMSGCMCDMYVNAQVQIYLSTNALSRARVVWQVRQVPQLHSRRSGNFLSSRRAPTGRWYLNTTPASHLLIIVVAPLCCCRLLLSKTFSYISIFLSQTSTSTWVHCISTNQVRTLLNRRPTHAHRQAYEYANSNCVGQAITTIAFQFVSPPCPTKAAHVGRPLQFASGGGSA